MKNQHQSGDSTTQLSMTAITRRHFAKNCTLGIITLLANPLRTFSSGKVSELSKTGPASAVISLDQNWLFLANPSSAIADDAAYTAVTLPHCVARLSWQNWDPALWQQVWSYRRHFTLPANSKGMRVFLHFDGVMVNATPTINGQILPEHKGGYLPFNYEITSWLKPAGNILDLQVDSRWSNVPPEGSPIGTKRVDYLETGGIYRSVQLKLVPQLFISDLFAKPVEVLTNNRRIEVTCSVDSAIFSDKPIQLQVELRDGDHVVAQTQQTFNLKEAGKKELSVTLGGLKDIVLWDVENPKLYHVVATVMLDGKPVHDYTVRTGLREAKFETDGFFLNRKRLQLFGLNRHESFPYTGGAMPKRVMRRDAEILRKELNCNMVRCSHYPQSAAFLDACDELGLMVWEEVPGWGYIGDDPWKEVLLENVRDMVTRDRNRPSVIIWGVRVNESANDPELYRKTTTIAKWLDDSRQTSGSMTSGSTKNWKNEWHQDVMAYDEYHADPDGSVGIRNPDPGVPYMLAEAVGQFNYAKGKGFDCMYRRAGDIAVQQLQALRHAQAHSRAGANKQNCGVIAWCAFEYASPVNPFQGVKYPGVADVFRIPKLGATFYRAQLSPKIRPVIEPNFYWDFGPQTVNGPGKNVAIFSNCQRLDLFVAGKLTASVQPDHANFPHLKHAPFFTDLYFDGVAQPELRIDGYVDNIMVISRSFSADTRHDRLLLETDDNVLFGDGADATRVTFRIVDKFGASRPFGKGDVAFTIHGPGSIVGDNPFKLEDSGGAGAIWVRTAPGSAGRIVLKATHSLLGTSSIEIKVRKNV
jgi:beta-galactosidase